MEPPTSQFTGPGLQNAAVQLLDVADIISRRPLRSALAPMLTARLGALGLSSAPEHETPAARLARLEREVAAADQAAADLSRRTNAIPLPLREEGAARQVDAAFERASSLARELAAARRAAEPDGGFRFCE